MTDRHAAEAAWASFRVPPLLRGAVAAARRIADGHRAAAALALGRDGGPGELLAAQEGPVPALPLATLRAVLRLVRRVGAIAAPDIADERASPWRAAAAVGVRSLAIVPLRLGTLGGCLAVGRDVPRPFTVGDLARLETVAACVGAAAAGRRSANARRGRRAVDDSVAETLRAIAGNLDRLDELVTEVPAPALDAAVRTHVLDALADLRRLVERALRRGGRRSARTRGIAQLSTVLRRLEPSGS